MTDAQTLVVDIRDGVAELRLNRPDLLNRFDMVLHRELAHSFEDLSRNDDVRAVVWTSTGRVFSAGGDTKVMLEGAGNVGHRMKMIDEGRHLFRTIADFPKPLIVALAGNSYGLSTSLILLADAIVSAPGIQISDPHVHMGLVAGDGGVVAWPASAGIIRAKRHLLTGDPLSAEDAYTLGIVTDLVDEADGVAAAAMSLARRMAALPPLAVQMTKRALAKVHMSRAEEALDYSFALEGLTFGTDDLREAVAAFKEKRPGNWKAR